MKRAIIAMTAQILPNAVLLALLARRILVTGHNVRETLTVTDRLKPVRKDASAQLIGRRNRLPHHPGSTVYGVCGTQSYVAAKR